MRRPRPVAHDRANLVCLRFRAADPARVAPVRCRSASPSHHPRLLSTPAALRTLLDHENGPASDAARVSRGAWQRGSTRRTDPCEIEPTGQKGAVALRAHTRPSPPKSMRRHREHYAYPPEMTETSLCGSRCSTSIHQNRAALSCLALQRLSLKWSTRKRAPRVVRARFRVQSHFSGQTLGFVMCSERLKVALALDFFGLLDI